MQSASLKNVARSEKCPHEKCCVKGQYREWWKYFEQVHSQTKKKYENMFFSDEAFFT
jgi:hypothetical protein